MTTSSKGKGEKCRLHTCVTTTVLDKSWWGTTELFVLHFNEQFRQLDEVSPTEESLPYTTRLTLIQTAVHNVPELRMVETMDEFLSLSSTTPGPTIGYDNYLTLLQNACIRYDSSQKSRPSPLPTNMTCLQTHMSTSIPRITLPQVLPMVALTCQLRNSMRIILPTSSVSTITLGNPPVGRPNSAPSSGVEITAIRSTPSVLCLAHKFTRN